MSMECRASTALLRAIVAFSLGAGNIQSAYGAYRTLGWGGFWAWDPVENSSFIPWFVSLALIHGLLIERRTGALRRINILLTAAVFLLVVYGTFLTRSGVLADFSVHSFVRQKLVPILRIGPDWSAAAKCPERHVKIRTNSDIGINV